MYVSTATLAVSTPTMYLLLWVMLVKTSESGLSTLHSVAGPVMWIILCHSIDHVLIYTGMHKKWQIIKIYTCMCSIPTLCTCIYPN